MDKTTDFPDITSPTIQAYCDKYSTLPQGYIRTIISKTEITGKSKMLSGEFLGQFLTMMSLLIRPKVILELGTFTGYGTLCLAQGLNTNGKIYTIEKNEEHYNLAAQHFTETSTNYEIINLLGDATTLIEQIDETIDLIFIDANKKQYLNQYELLLPKLKQGGVILADNILWKGKVGHPDNDKLGKSLDLFNQHVAADERVDNIILPIDDGVNFIIKR